MSDIRIFNYKVWENAHQQLFVNCPNVPFATNLDDKLRGSVAQEDFINLDKKVDVEGYFIYNFSKLREADGISPEMNRSRVFKAGEASGASGSFFFFSHDKNFIIKTISVDEK
jgi:Phosphatidylinositol-4-phosphate 5-Kinase